MKKVDENGPSSKSASNPFAQGKDDIGFEDDEDELFD